MAGHATTRVLLDLLSNELAYRSGLLLTQREIRDVARQVDELQYREILLGGLDEVISRVTDYYSDLARSLRVAIGNLPDDEPAMIRRVRVMQELTEAGYDPSKIMMALVQVGSERADKTLGRDAIEEVQRRTGAPRHVVAAVFLLIADQIDRESYPFGAAQEAVWDGVVPLSKLFSSELIPTDAEAYVDQRFLDYLAARGERINEIHWRNFERLCAEFFRRLGYVVLLGPGVADGGIDIRIFHQTGDQTPFLLIQCKRYKDHIVGIECVKALWEDVRFEGAERGLVITSSEVAPGGKVTATARGYRMGFAENLRVRQWARSMWRYSYDPPTRKMVPATPLG